MTTPTTFELLVGAILILLETARVLLSQRQSEVKRADTQTDWQKEVMETSRSNREQAIKDHDRLVILEKQVLDAAVKIESSKVSEVILQQRIGEMTAHLEESSRRIATLTAENATLRNEVDVLRKLFRATAKEQPENVQ